MGTQACVTHCGGVETYFIQTALRTPAIQHHAPHEVSPGPAQHENGPDGDGDPSLTRIVSVTDRLTPASVAHNK